MKAQWFTSRPRYDFGRLLMESDYSRRYDETFGSWLRMSSCTLVQANFAAAGVCSIAIEKEYMQAAKQVKKPEKLAEAFMLLADSLNEQPEDFLGKFVSELGMNDKSFRGQCFTPTEVCYCMAKMVMCDVGPPKEEPLRLAEPAVGCGAMVIATCRVLREQGYSSLDFEWDCTDVDWRMAASSFVQFTLLDIPAVVHHGNTLSNERWRSYHTFRSLQVDQIALERANLKRKMDALLKLLKPHSCDSKTKAAPPAKPERMEPSRLAKQMVFEFG